MAKWIADEGRRSCSARGVVGSLLLLAALLLGGCTQGASVPDAVARVGDGLTREQQTELLGRHAQLFQETAETPLTLDQARASFAAGKFHPSTRMIPSAGDRANPMWARLAIDHVASQAAPHRLFVAEGWADHVDAWLEQPDGRIIHWQGGDERSPSRDYYPSVGFGFDVELMPGRSVLFVRVQSIDSFVMPLRVVPMAATSDLQANASYWIGFVQGYPVALAVVMGLFWLVLRQRSQLLYVAYVAGYLLMNFASSGMGARHLWPHSTDIQRFAILTGAMLFTAAGLSFARSFLGISQWSKRTDRAIAWLVRLSMVAFAACVATNSLRWAVTFAFPYFILFTLLMVTLGILAVIRKRAEAGFFLASTLASMLGALATTLTVMGILPFWYSLFHGVELGIMLEASLWALALGLRLRRARSEHMRAVQLAKHDPLTGLYNRRGFQQHWASHSADAAGEDSVTAVMIVDIDRFKTINDTHGHDAGDRTLVQVAAALRETSGQGEVLARWGGEEFVILMPQTTLDAAHARATRLCEQLRHMQIALAHGVSIQVTASVGLAAQRFQPELELGELLRHADAALYSAKQAGRDRIVIAGQQQGS